MNSESPASARLFFALWPSDATRLALASWVRQHMLPGVPEGCAVCRAREGVCSS